MTTPLNTYDGQTTLTTSTSGRIARTSFPSASSDQQNFIALNPSAVLENGGATMRSPCGDLSPVRVRTSDASNRIFVYPRNSSDPSAETVRDSFVYNSPTDFRSALGRVSGNVYVGRTSAGGVGDRVDLNGDGIPDATFSATCGFMLQLQNGSATKVETDVNVTATIGGRIYNISAYTPVAVVPTAGNPPPSITLASNGTSFTAPATITLTATASDSNGAVTKVDFFQNGVSMGTADTTSPYTFTKTGLAAGSYAFSARATDNGGAVGTSNTMNVTVTTTSVAPSITTQPVSATVAAGQTATFSVAASGTAPLTYQWQKNSVNITNAISASYTTPATTTADNGATFRVTVKNSLGSVTSASATLTVTPTGGLVARWKLDETGSATIAADSSGNACNGTLGNYSASGWTTGKIAGALNFNGVANVVTVGSPAALTNLTRYTIAAWIKPRTFGEANLGRILNKRNSGTAGWSLFLGGQGAAFFRQTFSVTEGAWSTPVNTIALGTWQHVAVAYDGSLAANRPAFYVNGKLVTTTVNTAPSGSKSSDAASALSIGNTTKLERTFDGAIDDVRIYNRILSASEIGGLATAMPTGAG
jgi:hypothetical protein